jgi:hypothetical protein
MVKSIVLFGLMVVGGVLVVVGDLKVMMAGVFLATVVLALQQGWALYALAVAMDKNFEILEARLCEHISVRLSELERTMNL